MCCAVYSLIKTKCTRGKFNAHEIHLNSMAKNIVSSAKRTSAKEKNRNSSKSNVYSSKVHTWLIFFAIGQWKLTRRQLFFTGGGGATFASAELIGTKIWSFACMFISSKCPTSCNH